MGSLPLYFFILSVLTPISDAREFLIQRACSIKPDLSFCRRPITTEKIRTEREMKRDVFLQWAYVSAKDETDIEDVDELESSRKNGYGVTDYCAKYKSNFNTYCRNGDLSKLEGLLFHFCGTFMQNCNVIDLQKNIRDSPTSQPFVASSDSQKISYCDGNAEKYKNECEKEGFQPESFCRKYKEQCGKFDKNDAVTANSFGDDLDSSLELPDEFEEREKAKMPEPKEKVEPEGQGAGSDEVTVYCSKYVENYNFYCVGDMLPEHGKFCNSYKINCPDRVSLKQSGSFLGSDNGNGDDISSSSSDEKTYLYKGSKKEYCEKFSVNYEYYCKGNIENAEIFTKFCPSYKRACITNKRPEDPFSASIGQIKTSSGTSDFPDLDHSSTQLSSAERRRAKLLKRRPCSADCDENIFPHCTQECKCDYDYPAVQKFCNPPPLPLFLNTCRLWYYKCPKYEQYHYASQFIYSKAEKGKVLEGPKTSTTFQLLAPSGETLPYRPALRRFRRNTENDMVFWPDSSNTFNGSVPQETEKNGTIELDFGPVNGAPVLNTPVDSNESKEEAVDKIVKLQNGSVVHLVAAPPLPKEKKAKDQVPKDTDNAPPDLPRVKKTTGGEAVPVYSDSVFSNALAQYNALTDSRGILHRPRSRSPFTKPGLWEPNPDDPHNRDHANKYYYHPESVAVDWLQGQLAWGAHWAVPAAGTGGTHGFSAVHFPSIGAFLNIPDDYD